MKGTAEDIIGTLIDCVNQACQVSCKGNKIYCHHMFISSYEEAFSILEIEGYIRLIKRGKFKGKYELCWEPKFLKEPR